MKRCSWLPPLALLALAAASLWYRLPELDNRPLHADESVHAVKFRQLWQEGTYKYDPDEYHGPTLYYATAPLVKLAGQTDWLDLGEADYRRATALVGALMVPLCWLVADALGWPALLLAAGLLTVSSSFVFYSRYYIQETLLVAFTLALLALLWRWRATGRSGWLIATGVAAGLILATKETGLLAILAALVAARVARPLAPPGPRSWPLRIGAVVAAAVTASLVLSCFGHNPSGPLDLFRSYTPWIGRAGGGELHVQPWYYYFELLAYVHRSAGPRFSEGLILALAAVGLFFGLCRPAAVPGAAPVAVRFLTAWTLVLATLYSVIPYKTPWCLLNFHLGLIGLAGLGGVALVGHLPGRLLKTLATALILLGVVQLGHQSRLCSFKYPSDARNPYVYSPTAWDVIELGEVIERLQRASPEGTRTIVQVLSPDAYCWPIPWYIRRAELVGYYIGVPEALIAPLILTHTDFHDDVAARLGASHEKIGHYALRRGVLYELWVEHGLWERYLNP